jgi:hypothetical protein
MLRWVLTGQSWHPDDGPNAKWANCSETRTHVSDTPTELLNLQWTINIEVKTAEEQWENENKPHLRMVKAILGEAVKAGGAVLPNHTSHTAVDYSLLYVTIGGCILPG